MISSRILPLACLGLLAASCTRAFAAGPIDLAPSFARDVQPILSSKCYSCHGFDAEHREADLRLDVFADESSSATSDVVDVQNPDASHLIERVTATAPDIRMPPPHAGDALSEAQVSILRQWIARGAAYEQHWAFVPPRRPALPEVSDPAWPRNPIDYFVLAKLDEADLRPSPPASRSTLVRRLHLDLIGLPPGIEAVEQAGRNAPAYYDELVDDLLASPHYGERWARMWLDAARYADSDGFEKDKPRSVWMYRDWVIESFNNDLPYNQFIIRQVAGDLNPHATQDDHVATGFLRNSMINEEGGADPEQFRMEAIYDRMDAIGKGVLGITLQCAQCHTHKYDPLSHTEYYQLLAFLNNSYEGSIAVYDDQEQIERQEVLDGIRTIRERMKSESPDWQQRLEVWEATVAAQPQPNWEPLPPQLDGSGGQKHYLLDDASVLAAGYSPPRHDTTFTVETASRKISAIRLELMNHPDLPLGGPGRSPVGGFALSEIKVTAAPISNPKQAQTLRFATAMADVSPPEAPLKQGYYSDDRKTFVTGPVAFAHDGKTETAWTDDIGPGRRNQPREAVFYLDQPVESESGFRLTIRLVQQHGGANGNDIWNNNLGRFRFSITADDLPPCDPIPPAVRAILAIPRQQRTIEQRAKVFAYWCSTLPEWRDANAEIEQLWQHHPQGTSQLVLSELPTPRKTHRLDRGDFLSPRERVSPGVPDFLHPMDHYDETRIGFAQWLVDRGSPTTARSIVNRVWQAYFGQGLVTTPDDFGVQGAPPTHPELLDWLAVEFMENGWSFKHLHRLIVRSATYQQASQTSPELLDIDPHNRLLARGPRFRVDAEVVRDIALAASGLLNHQIGGPSVYPPAPEFLFQPPASYGDKHWDHLGGPGQYRRALYTFRYRSVPYPVLEVFDAPNGNVSCVGRTRSNTPLQALAMLNEPLFLECARELARTSLENAGGDDTARLQYAAARCLSRPLDETELTELLQFLNAQRLRLQNGSQASQIAGDSTAADSERPDELAAWVMAARVLLNLDETVTKE